MPKKISAANRILQEGNFVLTSTLRALRLRRADCYVIVSSPRLLGLAAWMALNAICLHSARAIGA